ncbi:putative LRR receptor-like serine/threonine-protein kinase GSO1 [Heracleum sosnowskyi]|uniref:LRR receptor-like serine/threonine-protein kinase GSO1 n=1 Tax=Heracleum sosnowskyi TaxID=360622 RepID=A0AAD8HB73_9APIA|nr:putative LRR receptor-like serine/threonine-protein kinase GSO1 [Heracleum sosnowskyi]
MRCIGKEREALLLFKHGVANEHDLLDSWKKEEEDCCKWRGVGCDNLTGHVTHLHLSSLISPIYTISNGVSTGNWLLDLPYLIYLDLSNNILVGFLEFTGSLTNLVHLDLSNTLFKPIPPQNWNVSNLQFLNQIGNLSNLKYLNLSNCHHSGHITKLIGNLSNLQHLDLAHNFMTGSIPDQIGNLSNLRYLSLGHNSFYGHIPNSIGSLNSLRYLDLSYNGFYGVIPNELGNLSKLQHLSLAGLGNGNFEWLFNLSSLSHLDLSYINITSPDMWVSFLRIPSISVLRLEWCNLLSPSATLKKNSSSISTLYLRGNNINSSIFYWLPHLNSSLVVLDLSQNVLEGKIPESIGHLTALTHLDLGHNLLTGPVSDSFALMTALSHLVLSANQLYGVIPKSICSLSSMEIIEFSFNNFTGNLEELLSGPFPHLKELSISDNQLTGSLPDFTLLPSLRRLRVNSNHLNGYLPTTFKHHSALQFLDLSNNHLKSSLPDFAGFSSLKLLYLGKNEFSGSLPDFTGCSSLRELRLEDNQLTEWESQSTRLPTSLEELDLSGNSINSTIGEAHLCNLSSLSFLRTSFNSLTFEFSSEWVPPFQLFELSLASCKLGPTFPNWIRNQGYIQHLDLSNSQISDTIPIWFWKLSNIIHLNISSNQIRGQLSWNYDNVSEESSLSFLDISHNQLFGALPDNWMQFWRLAFLNLGYNQFSGLIPTSLGHLVSLQTLILRNNKLYGEVPASLRNCSSLGFVDFGLNKLSGKLPSWIGEDLPQLYALILKSNKFYGSMPYEICHLSNLHFLDLSINKISGTIPPCFGNLTAMVLKGTEVAEHRYSLTVSPIVSTALTAPTAATQISNTFSDSVLARWKGQEFEYGRNFAYLKMIDLSTNQLTGEIPQGITRLVELKGLNLSSNRFYGKVPREIGQLKALECLDLSSNNFSGEIPPSMSGLNFLGYLDLSDNNFSGKIPSGTQLQGFSISAYQGNAELCGKPLTNICPGDEPADHLWPSSGEYAVDGDDSEYERWLLISAVLGFSTAFWGFIGTLVLNRGRGRVEALSYDSLPAILRINNNVLTAAAKENLTGFNW